MGYCLLSAFSVFPVLLTEFHKNHTELAEVMCFPLSDFSVIRLQSPISFLSVWFIQAVPAEFTPFVYLEVPMCLDGLQNSCLNLLLLNVEY